MTDDSAARTQVTRQAAHWTLAASRLQSLEDLASKGAWEGLERYLGESIRERLTDAVKRLQVQAIALRSALSQAGTPKDWEGVRVRLLAFRREYLRTETTIDFYVDAINTRASPYIAALLRTCDALAYRSMAHVLDQLGKPTPLVLTYIDKGLGASILKAGLRLWDRTESPAAAIKIVRHNLFQPTSLIHEAGHQVAHIVGWNDELASALDAGLSFASRDMAAIWAGWSSEVAADTFAFAHTGYAAVAALHDVLAGDDRSVFRYSLGDPHPISYVRVLLGVEMCRQMYGEAGPWNGLASDWKQSHPLQSASPEVKDLLRESLPLLPNVVELCLRTPMRAFAGRPLVALVDPGRVKPETLTRLEHQLGAALYTSTHWVWTESLRLLALTGFRAATMPERSEEIMKQQEGWMLRLGTSLRAA